MPQLGKLLVMAGLGIALAGLLIWLLGNKLHWFGHLPGDLRYEGRRVRVFAPFTTMLLLSILLSLVLWLIRKFF